MPQGVLSPKKGMLYYYKDPSYLDKNWAPEQIPEESLKALAQAQAMAVQKGILTPALAKQFLANSLVEGYTGGPTTVTYDKGQEGADMDEGDPVDISKERRGGYLPKTGAQFGADELGYDGPDIRKNLDAMGLKVRWKLREEAPAGAVWPPGTPLAGKPVHVFPTGRTHTYFPDNADLEYETDLPAPTYLPLRPNDPLSNAKLAAIILAKKASLYGEDKAIERWNGAGPDAKRHATRVAVMQQMLSHPSNAALMSAYNKYLPAQPQPVLQQPMQQQPQQSPYVGILSQQYLGQ